MHTAATATATATTPVTNPDDVAARAHGTQVGGTQVGGTQVGGEQVDGEQTGGAKAGGAKASGGRTDPDTARFSALGPLEIQTADGTPVFIGQRKKRRLLALLLLHGGCWVSTEQIGVALWEDDPPRSALGNIKTYVSELRHALPPLPPREGGAGHDPPAANHGPGRIVSRDGEYAIRLAPGEFDVEVFDALARAGAEALASEQPSEAARLLGPALELWHGRPYEDLPADVAVAETARLEELRWSVWENLIDARLQLGQHGLVLPSLRALTIEHPTRERLWAQLLVALDQDGRRAEALRAYQAVYRTLTERLGIEPGKDLRALHQRILRGTGEPTAHQPHQPHQPPRPQQPSRLQQPSRPQQPPRRQQQPPAASAAHTALQPARRHHSGRHPEQ